MKRAFVGALLVILLSGAEFSQSAATPPEFEVADVKLGKPGADRTVNLLPGGRVELRGLTMRDLIAGAWDTEDNMVTGGDAWLNSDRFDIVAKAEPGTPEATLRLMLRTLLAERFKLVVHSEEKIMPVYALALGKHTSKLIEAAGSGDPECKMRVIEGIRTYVCHNMTMEGLAQRLRGVAAAYLDHAVVDLTGLKGTYDFTLAWTGRGRLMGTVGRTGDASQPSGAIPEGVDPVGGLTVFEAVKKQLGLDLAPRKHPMPVIVVDHVDRVPTEN
jgi:uncharacterized protein (TIGR03435 family)